MKSIDEKLKEDFEFADKVLAAKKDRMISIFRDKIDALNNKSYKKSSDEKIDIYAQKYEHEEFFFEEQNAFAAFLFKKGKHDENNIVGWYLEKKNENITHLVCNKEHAYVLYCKYSINK